MENHEHDAGERFRVFAETPERDEVQVGRVEHEFDADEHEDGVAPRQRAGQADCKEHGRETFRRSISTDNDRRCFTS